MWCRVTCDFGLPHYIKKDRTLINLAFEDFLCFGFEIFHGSATGGPNDQDLALRFKHHLESVQESFVKRREK